jgi:hypothetical protein
MTVIIIRNKEIKKKNKYVYKINNKFHFKNIFQKKINYNKLNNDMKVNEMLDLLNDINLNIDEDIDEDMEMLEFLKDIEF